MNIFLIRHSDQLRLKWQKNVKDDAQTQNEKIVLSVEGEKKALEISNLQGLKIIDGESNKEVEKRMNEFFNELIKTSDDSRNIAVVSYGASIKFFLSKYCSLNVMLNWYIKIMF